MQSTTTESSPSASVPNVKSSSTESKGSSKGSSKPRARRRASGLGGELWGDTGAPAFATLDLWREGETKPRNSKPSRRRSPKQRNQQSWLQEYKTLALQHTWLTPLILLLTILTLYAVNPQPSNHLHKLIFLSYALPSTPGAPTQYSKGPHDLLFVAFYTIFLTFTRESIMQLLLRPLALHFHISTRSKQLRFMEQSYTALYFGLLGPIGLSVMSRTPVWYFNIAGMYADFPHKTISGEFKAYYLFQAAYWAQQGIVIGLRLEKPRKDFWQLVGHHVVTLVLIATSYRFHFTYMGIGVFITHDLSDCFFAISKTLHYINSRFTGPYFILFIGAWAYLRHYLNLRILLSEFYEFKTVGPYTLNWETEQYKCELSHWISTLLLGGLQMLNLYWGFLILRVAWRFGVKGELADERSEDEDEEVGEIERSLPEIGVLATEVGAKRESSEVQEMRRGAMPKRRAR